MPGKHAAHKILCPECGGPKTPRAGVCMECRKGNDERPFPQGGTERARFGCICTFENADGKVIVFHRVGPPSAVAREMCAEALALDPTFRLVSYSNPSTIYKDLEGHRKGNANAVVELSGSDRPVMPEAQLLGQLGLGHLLHPRLRA